MQNNTKSVLICGIILGAKMQKDLVSCNRYPDRTFFSFVNLFSGIRYPVNMIFMPDETVIVVVAGAQYQCKSDRVLVRTDLSSVECKRFEDLTYSIKVDQLSFYIPAFVHEQLISYPEFSQHLIINISEND